MSGNDNDDGVDCYENEFLDTSTECAICLGALDDGSDVITLGCGHRWHLECIKEQLEHAQPNPRKRLLFSGCRCAKCGSFCDHDELRHLTRKTDRLREEVDGLILEQIEIDTPRLPVGTTSRQQEAALLVEHGRRNYAFYLCHSCHKPFFGGTIDCADRVQDAQNDSNEKEEDRYCPACSPQIQNVLCRNPLEHRSFHVWKCRYCCQPATYVCYGSVHFCKSCHQRNDQRVQQQQRQGRRQRQQAAVPPLEPIPCPGGDRCCVDYPKPEGKTFHSNGSTPDCEQIYQCTCCASSSSSEPAIEPGSANFVVNPSGGDGLRGWMQMNRRMSWKVEHQQQENAADNDFLPPLVDSEGRRIRTNFVSGYLPCVMGQRVPIHGLVRDPSSVRIEVSARYLGRTDCPSVFQLDAVVLDANRREIARQTTGTLEAPVDAWERASIVLEPTPGTHDVFLVVKGKDTRFWQGDFGSKVAECSVRVLCPEDRLPAVLLPREEERNRRGGRQQQEPLVGGAQEEQQRRQYQQERQLRYQEQQQQQQQNGQRVPPNNDMFYNVLVPIMLFMFFWLVSS